MALITSSELSRCMSEFPYCMILIIRILKEMLLIAFTNFMEPVHVKLPHKGRNITMFEIGC